MSGHSAQSSEWNICIIWCKGKWAGSTDGSGIRPGSHSVSWDDVIQHWWWVKPVFTPGYIWWLIMISLLWNCYRKFLHSGVEGSCLWKEAVMCVRAAEQEGERAPRGGWVGWGGGWVLAHAWERAEGRSLVCESSSGTYLQAMWGGNPRQMWFTHQHRPEHHRGNTARLKIMLFYFTFTISMTHLRHLKGNLGFSGIFK